MRHTTKRKKKLYGTDAKLDSITLYYQKIAAEKFVALPVETRYCLLVMGHIHDELNWIQRMAFLATREFNFRQQVLRSGQMMQCLMLARLFFGKLLEFSTLLTPQNSPLRTFIAENFRPKDIEAGKSQVNELLGLFEAEKWVRLGRNKHFMHYPTLNDVRATLDDAQIQWDLEIYHGKRSNNTLYPTSDVMANYAWLRLANPEAPMDGLGDALDVLRSMSALSLSTLEQSIGYFVDRNLMPLSENEPIKLNVPNYKDRGLSYFLSLK